MPKVTYSGNISIPVARDHIRNTYGRIEQTTTNPEEDPSVYSERETKAECDVLQLLWITPNLRYCFAARRWNIVGDLCTRQSEV
jgi:hypothetical protein